MKRKIIRFLSFILVITVVIAPAALAADGGEEYDKLETVADLIRQYGVNSNDDDDPLRNALIDLMNSDPELFDKIMDAMLSHYDRYSNYVPEGMYDQYYPKAQKYVGVGIQMDTARKGGIFVKSLVGNSPAKDAGILPGDQIIAVDGKDVTGMTIEQISPLIRGEENTKVSITVRRPYADAPLTFSVNRKGLYVSNVTYTDMGGGVMYVRIARFGDYQTFLDFVSRYKRLPYEGYRSVVIDVRGNPGGDLNVLYNMLNYVVPDKDKTMFALRYRNMEVKEIKSTGIGWRPNKLVVLADGNSASAAEIFAGSLKDLGYADLVGQTTYGKGYGQLHIPLGDTSTAVISNFEIWLPVTYKYDGKGIEPTYRVALGQKPYPMPRLEPLYAAGDILPSVSYSPRAFALEQRLSLLGYLGKTPDGVFDSETLWAVNALERAHGLSESAGCPNAAIAALNADVEALSKTTVTVDTQLDKALELAWKAAEKPLSYTLPKVDLD